MILADVDTPEDFALAQKRFQAVHASPGSAYVEQT